MPLASSRTRLPAALIPTLLAVTAVGLAGCSSMSDGISSSKVDYRAKAQTGSKLDVPPDLTQLATDSRYQPPTGAAVSASAFKDATPQKAGSVTPVAPDALGGNRIERTGNARWLVSPLTPEQLWPRLREFWQANGFPLLTDRPEIGLMETDWLENRNKLPQDFFAKALSKVVDSALDSGERDRYRLRVERTAQGTEVTISHKGAVQVVTGQRSGDRGNEVAWTARASEPGLEAEMLSRLLVQLSAEANANAANLAKTNQTAVAAAAVANAPTPPARARLDAAVGANGLQVDDPFDRAWRRVGVALDRGGFTVEDRDRSQGLYFVRYVDPKLAGKEEPNFLARWFGAKKEDLSGRRYRIKVAAQGNTASTVLVADDDIRNANADAAKDIAQLLLAELR